MMGQEDKKLLQEAYYKAGVKSLGKLCDFLFNCGLLEKKASKGAVYHWYKEGLSSNIKNIIKLFLSKEDFENYQKLQALSILKNPNSAFENLENDDYKETYKKMMDFFGVNSMGEVCIKLGFSEGSWVNWTKAKRVSDKALRKFNALKAASENTPSKTPALKSNKTITYYPNIYASAGFGTINEDNSECVVFDASLLSVVNIPKNSEMIQIKGDSMLPFVENGEFAIIERTSVAKNGDIVIANYNGELYIKHFQRNPAKKTISLISSNPSYPSFEISEEENLTIIGVLKATIRPR